MIGERDHMGWIGLGFRGNLPLRQELDLIKKAEMDRAHSVWFAEHIGEGREAVARATVAITCTNTLKVGTAVINPYNRNPAVIASTAASLNELSNGRFILGLGTGNLSRMKEKTGVVGSNSVDAIVEAVEIIRRLMSGESVTFNGEHFKANMTLGFEPARTRAPIYLAAVGKKMLNAAAKIGDGVIFTFGASAGYLRDAVKLVRDINKRLELVAPVACFINEDRSTAKSMLAEDTFQYLTRPGRGELMFKQSGLPAKLPAQLREIGKDAAIRELLIDDRILEFGIAGTSEDCEAQISAMFNLGIDGVVLMPKSNDEFERILPTITRVQKS